MFSHYIYAGHTAITDTEALNYLTSDKDLADSWFAIGQYLELEESKLRSIREEHCDSTSKLNKVWEQWLKQSDHKYSPTTGGLYSLLKASGHNKNAKQVMAKIA